MKTSRIETLELSPSSFWCLHPDEFRETETPFGAVVGAEPSRVAAIHEALAHRFATEDTQALIARPACVAAGVRGLLRPPTASQWLSRNGGVSTERAQSIIDGFPIDVNEEMCRNARNPLQFLGVAAAIARQPEVVVYATSGMDPRGIALLHEYACKHFQSGCLVHISTHRIGSVPCAASARCIVL